MTQLAGIDGPAGAWADRRLDPVQSRQAAASRRSGVLPHLSFCCELPPDRLTALFADGSVLADLAALGASVSLALIDFSAERASAVRRLNEAGVPVTAWLVLERGDGYYCTPDNAHSTALRYDAFKTWSAAERLSFVGVAFDIEPAIQELEAMAGPERGPVLRQWAGRLFDHRRLGRALVVYRDLLAQVRADGYRTETYQFGTIVEEREAGSAVLQRAVGSMDLRADREWLMLYSSLLNDVAAGFLWNYAGGRARPAVGDTGGTGPIPALSCEQFARDLRLASRWGNEIAVFSLEGCVKRGYLAKLRDFDWDEPPAEPALARPMRMAQPAVRAMLAAAEHPLVALAALVAIWRLLRHPRLALGWLAAGLAHNLLVRPRLRTWGATTDEARRSLPGDEVMPVVRVQHTRATTIDAPPAAVWPWLVQLGFRRGGYYYPGWIDRLWGVAIRRRYRSAEWYTDESVANVNADRIIPELQDLRIGDRIQDGPDGYFEVREVIPERALVLYTARHPLSGRPLNASDPRVAAYVECSWAFVLEPTGDDRTRILVRTRGDHTPGPLAGLTMLVLFEPADWLMQTIMLRGLRNRAEREARAADMR
ncbi:MAG TPA: hypothetical protein VF071_11375 [Candidatus Limnocylindria bacterium]